MNSDVDLDQLADFVGGALDGTPDADAVRHRIETEPTWAAAYASLSAASSTVGAELDALRDEAEPMPADVVARLERVLYDAGEDAGQEAPVAPDASAESSRRAQPGRRAESSRRAQPNHRPAASPTRTGQRRRRTVLATAAAVLVCAAGGVAVNQLQRGTSSSTNAPAAGVAARGNISGGIVPYSVNAYQVLASGADYRPETLGSLASGRALGRPMEPGRPAPNVEGASGGGPLGGPSSAAGIAGSPDSGPDAAAVPTELDPLLQSTARDGCVAAVTAQYGGRVTLIDLARFEGRPAAALILQGAGIAGGRLLAVVVGPGCGSNAATDELYHAVA